MASRTTTDPIEILLEVGIDLDNLSGEEDYLSALMEAVAIIELLTKGKGDKRSAILRKEVIRVRKSRKERDKNFKARKTTVSASSFKKGTASAGRKKSLSPGIEPQILLLPSGSFDEKEEKKAAKTKKATGGKQKDLLQGIAKSVSNIADIMKNQYGLKKKKGAYDRKRAEAEKRKLKESNLEKSFKGLSSAAEKIIKPVKGILDKILDFFLKIIVGRFLVKLIGWIGDPKNKKKVDSVVRFLVDHGPKLLAAFLLFGTSIGRFAVRLSTVLLKGALRLGAAAAKFAIGFARRHPAAAAITAIVGGAAIAGAMNKKDDADADDSEEKSTKNVTSLYAGGLVPSYAGGGQADFKNLKQDKGEEEGKENLLSKLFGMTPTGMALKGAMSLGGKASKGISSFGSSVKEKGFGNAALDFAGGAFGNLKGFMDEKGITDVLMMHPLAKMGAFGFEKGKEAFGNLKGFMDDKGITDALAMHPLAKMGAFGLDKFMNFGKDPARDITGQSGQDIKGAGSDTQLISARPGDFVVNKKTADAMGPDYFDAISTSTGEKVSGAGPDSQMIAVRPGEIVVNRETVNALGADHFLSLNRLFGGGGANKPKMANVQAASGGGFVLPAFSSGGLVSGDEKQPGGGAYPAISVSHPNTGSGFGLNGVVDYKGRPAVFSKGAAEAFGKMIAASGGAVKGADIHSSKRSKSYNAHVGGVSNSNHLYGNALDIHGTSQTWMRANGRKYGWIVNDYPGSHGGHFNYKGGTALTPDEGSPVAQTTGQGGGGSGGSGGSGGGGYRGSGSSGGGGSSIVLALKNGVQGKLDTATGKFTPAEFTKAESARYTQMGGKIPDSNADPEKKALTDIRTRNQKLEELRKKLGRTDTLTRVLDYFSGTTGDKAVETYTKMLAEKESKEKAKTTSKTSQATPSAQATKRHAELMKSTDQKKIADYDAKHGAGAYSKKLQEKLNKIYPNETAKDPESGLPIKPTGKVVGRENLPPATRALLEKMDAQRASGTADMLYTRKDGSFRQRISAEEFNRVKSGNIIPGGGKPGGLFGGLFGGMGKPPTPPPGAKIIDGNIGTPTAQEQKDLDALAAKKAKLRATEAKLGTTGKDLVTPGPPPGGGSNVKVVRAPSSEQKSTDKQGGGGSDVDASPAGNGNKAKWNILGIPMPF